MGFVTTLYFLKRVQVESESLEIDSVVQVIKADFYLVVLY